MTIIACMKRTFKLYLTEILKLFRERINANGEIIASFGKSSLNHTNNFRVYVEGNAIARRRKYWSAFTVRYGHVTSRYRHQPVAFVESSNGCIVLFVPPYQRLQMKIVDSQNESTIHQLPLFTCRRVESIPNTLKH